MKLTAVNSILVTGVGRVPAGTAFEVPEDYGASLVRFGLAVPESVKPAKSIRDGSKVTPSPLSRPVKASRKTNVSTFLDADGKSSVLTIPPKNSSSAQSTTDVTAIGGMTGSSGEETSEQ